MSAVQNAKVLTRTYILAEPYQVASDFNEAANLVIDFVHDKECQSFLFGVDTGGSAKSYAFFKLPYSDEVDLTAMKLTFYMAARTTRLTPPSPRSRT